MVCGTMPHKTGENLDSCMQSMFDPLSIFI
jgi:hypothetical protein